VVEDDALNVRAGLEKTCFRVFVRSIDLEVVFELALARETRAERLVMVPIEVPMALEEAAPVLRKADRMVAVSGHARGLDQPLFAQVPQVARTWIGGVAVVVAEITTGDHSECADGRKRSRFGAAQGVLAIAVVNELAVSPARK
jgi:hypothetical protein